MTSNIRVLLTGVGGGSIGGQICKALRQGRHRYMIVATNTDKIPLSASYADVSELVPLAYADEYLDIILEILQRYDIQFLIPGSEPELVKLSQNRDKFEQSGVHLLTNSIEVISICLDKKLTFEHLEANGFQTPKTIEVTQVSEGEKVETDFPVIIKPAKGGSGSAATFLAQSSTELRFFVNYLLKFGYRVLVQEYIGTVDQEYTIGVLSLPNQELVGSIIMRRNIVQGMSNRLSLPNQTERSELGSILAISTGISQGSIVECPPIKSTAEAIARSLGSVGPLNIQGRWNGVQFVPFEINPRFSGTAPMRALAGFNEPEELINYYLNPDYTLVKPEIRYGEFTRGLVEFFAPYEKG